METYLYFRKFRPATLVSTQGSATQALNAFSVASIGGAVDGAGYKVASATEIASMTTINIMYKLCIYVILLKIMYNPT